MLSLLRTLPYFRKWLGHVTAYGVTNTWLGCWATPTPQSRGPQCIAFYHLSQNQTDLPLFPTAEKHTKINGVPVALAFRWPRGWPVTVEDNDGSCAAGVIWSYGIASWVVWSAGLFLLFGIASTLCRLVLLRLGAYTHFFIWMEWCPMTADQSSTLMTSGLFIFCRLTLKNQFHWRLDKKCNAYQMHGLKNTWLSTSMHEFSLLYWN